MISATGRQLQLAPAHDVRSVGAPPSVPARTRSPRRLRVVQVAHGMSFGGLERVIVTLAQHLDPAEFDVRVLCIRFRGPLADELDAAGIPVTALADDPTKGDYLAPLKVARYLRAARPDVVHTHNTHAFLDGGIGAVLARVPAFVHTDHARIYPDKRRYLLAEHVVSWAADRVVGCSEHTTGCLATHQKIARHRLVTIPNGIDGTPFGRPMDVAAKRRELGVTEPGPVLGTIARLEDQKGIGFLLDALPPLVARFPTLRYIVVGDGSLRPALEAQAAALGIAGHVVFTGMRRDAVELMQAFDVFVLPSIWEGLPLTALEAMAAGVPVVATAVGGTPTAVEDGVTGFLVPPSEPVALTTALGRLLGDDALRLGLGARGRARFEERFAAEAMVRAYADLYRQVARTAVRG